MPFDPKVPDVIHSYVDREPTPEDPVTGIQIQRLRSRIDPNTRLKEADIPKIEGIKISLQECDWNGRKMDVMRQDMSLQNGKAYLVYVIQFPLAGEAVQMRVGGRAERESAVSKLFAESAAKFQNTKPLVTTNPTDKMTDEFFWDGR